MCAVVFFPLGFNETPHKFEERYLQENQAGVSVVDRIPDFAKEKCGNHNFIKI